MGGRPSMLGHEEPLWALEHRLHVDSKAAEGFQLLVQNFRLGAEGRMCWRYFQSTTFRHYYITDGTWTIEFGRGEGDPRNGSCSKNQMVQIHCEPLPRDGLDNYVESTFTFEAGHHARMSQVVGATAHSLALRNSEHVARYIHSGAWVSMQMLPGGVLERCLLRHLPPEAKQQVNSKPLDLQTQLASPGKLFAQEDAGYIKLLNSQKFGLSEIDDKAYNIVVIGPTGAGKSSIINRLFNARVTRESASVQSVTREIAVFPGEALLRGADQSSNAKVEHKTCKVNVIDTIGFCDSAMQPKEVVALIKQWLKVQRIAIDKVVVVVSGRIEQAHAQSIKDMMKWFEFSKYKLNFMFVYNRADMIEDPAEVHTNVAMMSEMLGTEFAQLRVKSDVGIRSLSLNMPLGIPPTASFSESQAALKVLADPLFTRVTTGRIPVDTATCAIL